MNPTTLRQYRRNRHDASFPWATGAKFALDMARAQTKPGLFWDDDLPHGIERDRLAVGYRVTQQDELTIVGALIYDDDYDWSDESPLTYDEAFGYLASYGCSRAVRREMAAQAVTEYTERQEHRSECNEVYGIVVTVYRTCESCGKPEEVGHASCWGFEVEDSSDSYLAGELDGLTDEALFTVA